MSQHGDAVPPLSNLHQDLELAIDETVARVATQNEKIIADIRAVGLTVFAFFGMSMLSAPGFWVSVFWATCAWAIVFVVRRERYRDWAPYVTFAADATCVASISLFVSRHDGVSIAAIALAAALVAISGGVRPQRWWGKATTAGAVFIVALTCVAAKVSLIDSLLLCTQLLLIGALGALLTNLSNQALENEVHRVVASRFLAPQVLEAGSRQSLRSLTEARLVDATVLISDIRSFTAYAETHPPGEVLQFLNDVQGAFAAIIQEHGGRVDKFMGDGMLAVFGIDGPIEEQASRAIAAAREMAGVAERFGVRIGIGIHSGRVIAGVLGSSSRLELTVIGDTVNVAARLEALTKEKKVLGLLSESVAERAGSEGRHLVRLGAEQLRGRSNAIVLYALTA